MLEEGKLYRMLGDFNSHNAELAFQKGVDLEDIPPIKAFQMGEVYININGGPHHYWIEHGAHLLFLEARPGPVGQIACRFLHGEKVVAVYLSEIWTKWLEPVDI